MANEIAATFVLKIRKDGYKFDLNLGKTLIDQATVGEGGPGIQRVGTSAETIAEGDITTMHYCFMENLDDTNFVTVGVDDTGQKTFMKFLPGDWAFFPLAPGIVIKATADTAECKFRAIIWEV